MFAPDDEVTPGGYRTDMYVFYSGGDADRFEARGNVYLFDGRMHTYFDSLQVEINLSGPTGAGPQACELEPNGWIGLRDQNAYWFDLVFEPRRTDDIGDPDYDNEPYTGCDGCGTLYIRGLQDREVCIDFSFLWEDGFLSPPSAQEFVMPIRNTVSGSAP